jgi:hypothetical protein
MEPGEDSSVDIIRDDDGTFRVELSTDERSRAKDRFPTIYLESLPRNLTTFDAVFRRARARSEFFFVMALLRVRGIEDAGWDPYETTLHASKGILQLSSTAQDFYTQRNVQLWIYGHLVEAAEPYETIRNMIGISQGEPFKPECFPPEGKRPSYPSDKIREIEKAAKQEGHPEVAVPLRERWDRDLRNAIFHADYALHGSEVRIREPRRSYTNDEVLNLLNRAKASDDAISLLRTFHVQSYSVPRILPIPRAFGADPYAGAQLIIREDEGVTAMRATWPVEPPPDFGEKVQWSFGRFYAGEAELLDREPDRLILPARPAASDVRPLRSRLYVAE